MDSTFQTSQLIPPNDIDFTNRLKPSALFNFIQSAAAEHAESLHLGYENLSKIGLFWVLSWARVEFDHYPQYRNRVIITTWPYGRHRLFSLRDFIFADSREQVFARAGTAWLLVNADARRITDLNHLPHPVPYQSDKFALDVLPGKLLPLEGAQPVLVRTIGYTDLDLIQHMNSAKYVEFIQDSYPLAYHTAHRIRALTIAFQNEIKYGERLVVSRLEDPQDPNCHHIAGSLAEEGKPIFRADLDWE